MSCRLHDFYRWFLSVLWKTDYHQYVNIRIFTWIRKNICFPLISPRYLPPIFSLEHLLQAYNGIDAPDWVYWHTYQQKKNWYTTQIIGGPWPIWAPPPQILGGGPGPPRPSPGWTPMVMHAFKTGQYISNTTVFYFSCCNAAILVYKRIEFCVKKLAKKHLHASAIGNFFLGAQPPDPQWEEIPSHTLPSALADPL